MTKSPQMIQKNLVEVCVLVQLNHKELKQTQVSNS